MSLVKANTYQDASGGSNAVFSGVASPPNSMGFRNRIINGNMAIDQRNAGASVTPTVNPQYLVDRWAAENSTTNKLSYQQNAGSVTPPASFSNYLGCTSLSAYSVASGDYFLLQQRVEGYNFADMDWGTANAKTVTLSFWVRSSLTGTFGGNVQNEANNRFYAFSYTISAANTWEFKTITITGDTSGTWAKTNGTGVMLRFSLGTGSTYLGSAGSWGASALLGVTGQVNLVGTNGATFYITGVQLEAGTNASPFERRDYGRELIMCQRYYWKTTGSLVAVGAGVCSNTTSGNIYVKHPVTMRAAPTYSQSSTYLNIGSSSLNVTSIVATYAGTDSALVQLGVASGAIANSGALWLINTGSAEAAIEL